jgi:hypothetical protein
MKIEQLGAYDRSLPSLISYRLIGGVPAHFQVSVLDAQNQDERLAT